MHKLDLEMAEEQEIKLPTPTGSQKNQENSKEVYFCFTDDANASDCVDHSKLWKILKEMGLPGHLIQVIPEWSSDFPYFLQFKSEFGNKEFMI